MDYFISAITGYLLGSLPTGYLLLKKSKGIDIRKTGSGNVGAMNTYEITNSKLSGVIVLTVDLLKGMLSVLIINIFYPEPFLLSGLALFFAVFSHCFNPWLQFSGGRGLATAAGGSMILVPILMIIWIILWVIFYMMRKDILFANIASTIMSILTIFNSEKLAARYSFITAPCDGTVVFISTSVLILILIKHIEPFKELIQKSFRAKNDQ